MCQMQSKMIELERACKALKNCSIANPVVMKHNATQAIAMACDLIQDLIDSDKDRARQILDLKRQLKNG